MPEPTTEHYDKARYWLQRAEERFEAARTPGDFAEVMAAATLAETHLKLGDRSAASTRDGGDGA